MKKLQARIICILMVVGATLIQVSPATADRPTALPTIFDTFQDVNPCTGAEQTVTIFLDPLLHVHVNGTLLQIIRTGFTDGGYEMFNAHEVRATNFQAGQAVASFVDLWRSDGGSMFQAISNVIIRFDPFEIIIVNRDVRCLLP